MVLLLGPLLSLLPVTLVVAQQSSSSASRAASTTTSNTTTPNVTSIVTSTPVTRTTISAGNTLQVTSFVPTTVVLTIAPSNNTATSTANATATHATATPTQPSVPVLDTRVDPAFGVVGALLILTGLPSAFLGHKNRWYVCLYPMYPRGFHCGPIAGPLFS